MDVESVASDMFVPDVREDTRMLENRTFAASWKHKSLFDRVSRYSRTVTESIFFFAEDEEAYGLLPRYSRIEEYEKAAEKMVWDSLFENKAVFSSQAKSNATPSDLCLNNSLRCKRFA